LGAKIASAEQTSSGTPDSRFASGSPGPFRYTRAFRAEEMDSPAFWALVCVFLFFRSDSDTSVESVIALQRNSSDGPWWTNNVFR
jgi:hypothetical protein